VDTRFPYDSSVVIKLGWAEASVTAVSATVNLRIPSWLAAPLGGITINGKAAPSHGQPGSFLKLEREWRQGDTIAFTLPTVYKVTAYTGADQLKGFEGRRYALSVGPIVLGCVGAFNATTNAPVLPVAPTAAAVAGWLLPVAGKPLNFGIKGAPGVTFMPQWEMQALDRFTSYPIMSG
jgi:DUF1680 family protein